MNVEYNGCKILDFGIMLVIHLYIDIYGGQFTRFLEL